MTTKHTSGPWESRSIPGQLFEIHDASRDPVFRIRGGMNPTLADARLIAAAPELLAACERALALSIARSESRQKWTQRDQDVHEALKAAYTKATHAQA